MRSMGKWWELARVVNRPRCASGKTRFLTAALAAGALATLERKAARLAHETNRLWPMRSYQCPLCAGWHLTSQIDKGDAADG